MHFYSILIGSLNLSYQLIYLSLTLYKKQQNFSRAKRWIKVDFVSFRPTKQQKKTENAIYWQGQKSHKLWFENI